MKVMIGAGRQKRAGWLTLDGDPRSGADIVAIVPPLPQTVHDARCEAIEMIHFLEHLYLWEARQLLRECRQVLRPCGKLIIECPDIAYAAKVLLGLETPPRGRAGQFDMWPLYGDPSHGNPLFGHRWGYTPESLTAELVAAGFARNQIAVVPARHHFPVRDFRVEATLA